MLQKPQASSEMISPVSNRRNGGVFFSTKRNFLIGKKYLIEHLMHSSYVIPIYVLILDTKLQLEKTKASKETARPQR